MIRLTSCPQLGAGISAATLLTTPDLGLILLPPTLRARRIFPSLDTCWVASQQLFRLPISSRKAATRTPGLGGTTQIGSMAITSSRFAAKCNASPYLLITTSELLQHTRWASTAAFARSAATSRLRPVRQSV